MLKQLKNSTVAALLVTAGVFTAPLTYADHMEGHISVYDESAYTATVAKTMKKLDKLYLQFCNTCDVAGDKAVKARREYLTLARELMKDMNEKFDGLNPKAGAALSDTEILVSIHALTMLVDILAATELAVEMDNPNN